MGRSRSYLIDYTQIAALLLGIVALIPLSDTTYWDGALLKKVPITAHSPRQALSRSLRALNPDAPP